MKSFRFPYSSSTFCSSWMNRMAIVKHSQLYLAVGAVASSVFPFSCIIFHCAQSRGWIWPSLLCASTNVVTKHWFPLHYHHPSELWLHLWRPMTWSYSIWSSVISVQTKLWFHFFSITKSPVCNFTSLALAWCAAKLKKLGKFASLP